MVSQSMDYLVRFEFSVQRRVPWEGEPETFRGHIGAVCDDLAGYGQVREVRSESDLGRNRVTIEVTLGDADRVVVETEARDLVGRAIRDAGAYHRGLLSAGDELRLRPDLNAWSGLRTPTWQVRRTMVETRGRTRRSTSSSS